MKREEPGQSAYHGALFATNGSPWENARDPFSASKASLGKQRYDFELTGPIRKPDSDFSLTLEHRSIDDFAVINAVALDNAGNPVNTVATPQRLWFGTARLDWQVTPRNTFIASYSANVDHLENVGGGGTALADTGYDSQTYEHMFRLSDVTTASAHFMHEARLSLRWDGEDDLPVSTVPQVQVAGAFTSGGANMRMLRMYGPPRDCKGKFGREDKSAQMYSAFGWRVALLARMSCARGCPLKLVGR